MNYYYVAGAIALAVLVGMIVAIVTYDENPVRLSPVMPKEDEPAEEDAQNKKFDIFSSVRASVAEENWDEFVNIIRAMPDGNKISDGEIKLFWNDLRAGNI